jgi:hypothetical protein
MDLEDRQAFAALGGLLVLCIAVPVIVILGSFLATGWAAVIGVHPLQETIWGWLSTKSYDSHGKPVFGVGSIVWEYFLSVVSAYIVYQLCELGYASFRAFRRALA